MANVILHGRCFTYLCEGDNVEKVVEMSRNVLWSYTKTKIPPILVCGIYFRSGGWGGREQLLLN